MDIKDVADWVVFALICAVPTLLMSRRIWIRIAIFLGSIAAVFVLLGFAVLASISGNTLIAVALPCPAHATLRIAAVRPLRAYARWQMVSRPLSLLTTSPSHERRHTLRIRSVGCGG